jgi:hypothetical protein
LNSIAIDYDENIIISSRHLSEITKIDRITGEIIWRLGGVNNQFTFIDEDIPLSYQHDARPVPGKPNHYTCFDNGTHRNPKFSRAVEYKIDTINMTATKVWEYRDSPNDRYSWFMGNAQRLSNGNTLINWADYPFPKITEVSPEGEKLLDASFELDLFTYRTHKFEWESIAIRPYLIIESFPEKITLLFNKFGDQNVSDYIIYSGTDPDLLYPIDTVDVTLKEYSNLENGQRHYFKVTARDSLGNESEFSNFESVFVKYSKTGDELILNGNFDDNGDHWIFWPHPGSEAYGSVNEEGEYYQNIVNPGKEIWSIQFFQGNIPLINGREYIFEFDIYSNVNRLVEAKIETARSPWINYGRIGLTPVTREKKRVQYIFRMHNVTDFESRVIFNSGKHDGGKRKEKTKTPGRIPAK